MRSAIVSGIVTWDSRRSAFGKFFPLSIVTLQVNSPQFPIVFKLENERRTRENVSICLYQ